MKPQPQLMADLLPERLSYSQPPFSFTGVDYFGLVTVNEVIEQDLYLDTIKDTFAYLPVLLFVQFN